MKRKTIFRDSDIVAFCLATKDSNRIHDPEFMRTRGKRVIVPGMFAFSSAAALDPEILKRGPGYIKVLFSTLLSSGDFVTLKAERDLLESHVVRLSALNKKDTLMSSDDFTRMENREAPFGHTVQGNLHSLPVEPWQTERFAQLIGTADRDTTNFLFAVAYASHALHLSIDHPETEVEQEIDHLINGNSRIAPFYHTLEIAIPGPMPRFDFRGTICYRIHFERERQFKLYTANVSCESGGRQLFYSRYSLMGIPQMIIMRMAKDILHPRMHVPEQ
jgi:hypothetical protein